MTTAYQRQLTYLFDRPVTQPEWFWAIDENTDLFRPPLAAFEFMETLLPNIKADLAPYSNDQIAHGLRYIFNGSCSDLCHDFKAAPVTAERRVKALKSLLHLFQDIFNPRCGSTLLANSREAAPQLDSECYMFWDVTPLSAWMTLQPENAPKPNPEFMSKMMQLDASSDDYLDQMKALMEDYPPTLEQSPEEQQKFLAAIDQQYDSMDAETQGYYQAIARVMQQCLTLSNPICIESGLHGLGHMATFQKKLAVPIIDDFLKTGQQQDPKLVEYAKAARTGVIQ